jgi:ribonuclease PH
VAVTRTLDELRPGDNGVGLHHLSGGFGVDRHGERALLCNATVEETLPRWLASARPKQGWVTAEYAMLPHATEQREPSTRRGLPRGGRRRFSG